MPAVDSINSSQTGLRFAIEESIGVLPASPVWHPAEPNSYSDFGPQITTLARDPISADRQSKKGMVVGLNASGGFQTDFTQTNIHHLMPAFMFAAYRSKVEVGGDGEVTGVSSGDYVAASGMDDFAVGDLVFAKNFDNPTNNGLKEVTGATGTNLTVTPATVDEASPPDAAQLVKVGAEISDLVVDASGAFPAITSATFDLTDLGLTVGEWLFLGGDAAGDQFSNAENNTYARIRSIASGEIQFDKTLTTMVDEVATNVHVFIGRLIKNEKEGTIARTTVQLEQDLGVPNTDNPGDRQYQYVTGCVANTMDITIGLEDKVMMDLGFLGLDGEQLAAGVGPKTGDRPDLEERDAFNTSSDFAMMRIAPVNLDGSVSTPLFGFLTSVDLSINNNASVNKAIGRLGGFDINVGKFKVNGNITAYFTDVAAMQSIRSNTSITMDFVMAKNNSGVLIDMPLITLGEGVPNIEVDTPVTIPVSFEAASGAQVDPELDTTLQMIFFDYLPDAAEVSQ